jgi:hypothetical protein
VHVLFSWPLHVWWVVVSGYIGLRRGVLEVTFPLTILIELNTFTVHVRSAAADVDAGGRVPGQG